MCHQIVKANKSALWNSSPLSEQINAFSPRQRPLEDQQCFKPADSITRLYDGMSSWVQIATETSVGVGGLLPDSPAGRRHYNLGLGTMMVFLSPWITWIFLKNVSSICFQS